MRMHVFSLICGIKHVTKGEGELLPSLYKAEVFSLTLRETRFKPYLEHGSVVRVVAAMPS
jgi:hypothetical protein